MASTIWDLIQISCGQTTKNSVWQKNMFFSAVIFDMDGVISDTQRIKTQISCDLLFEKYGVELSPEEYEEKYSGMKTRHIFKSIFNEFEIDDDVDQFIEYRIEIINSKVEKQIPLIDGSLDLIEELKDQNLKLAVASGGMRYFVDLVLGKLSIKDKFDAIAYSDEVEEAKPNPEIYLLAAEKLGVEPNQCLVIEDSVNGIIAAKKAGMTCIGLVESIDYDTYPADLLVEKLEDIEWDKLQVNA